MSASAQGEAVKKTAKKTAKSIARWFVNYWPCGNYCKFKYGNLQVTLTKQLWVVVSDGKSKDALPLTFVSQGLVDRIAAEMAKKWWAKG